MSAYTENNINDNSAILWGVKDCPLIVKRLPKLWCIDPLQPAQE